MRQCEVYIHGIRAGVLTEDDNRTYTFICCYLLIFAYYKVHGSAGIFFAGCPDFPSMILYDLFYNGKSDSAATLLSCT